MLRRDFLRLGSFAALGGLGWAAPDEARQLERLQAETRARIFAQFPYPHVAVRGDRALATWQMIKALGKGTPVVIGNDENAERVMGAFNDTWGARQTPDAILATAAALKIPDDLFARRTRQDVAAIEAAKRWLSDPATPLPRIVRTIDPVTGNTITTTYVVAPPSAGLPEAPLPPNSRFLSPDEIRTELLREHLPPEIGPWPTQTPPSAGLSVAVDLAGGGWQPKVHVATLPTNDWTTAPAWLRWGGWNDCPPPEWHVAALRSWRDRYGAELVGLGPDVMNLRVARRPQSRGEALALAREHYAYCPDIVEQGCETFSNLAATLMADDWWFFWWD